MQPFRQINRDGGGKFATLQGLADSRHLSGHLSLSLTSQADAQPDYSCSRPMIQQAHSAYYLIQNCSLEISDWRQQYSTMTLVWIYIQSNNIGDLERLSSIAPLPAFHRQSRCPWIAEAEHHSRNLYWTHNPLGFYQDPNELSCYCIVYLATHSGGKFISYLSMRVLSLPSLSR